MSTGPLRSISSALAMLEAEFPDLSISKIRYLEGQGLLNPERTPTGYRRYSPGDIERLRYILRLQRDHYLPLGKIHERLKQMDSGAQPIDQSGELPALVTPPASAGGEGEADQSAKQMKLTRRELITVSGLSEVKLMELVREQMVVPRRGTLYYGREALMICVVARMMQSFGMDIRHLRAIKQSAEREAGLIEQATLSLRYHPQGAQSLREATQLVMQAHSALVYVVMHR